MTACMGGWCGVRDKCSHYRGRSAVVVERLCEANEIDAFEKVNDDVQSVRIPTERQREPSMHGLPGQADCRGAVVLPVVVRGIPAGELLG